MKVTTRHLKVDHAVTVNATKLKICPKVTKVKQGKVCIKINIPGKHDIKELQKTVTLGTAHMPWEIVM